MFSTPKCTMEPRRTEAARSLPAGFAAGVVGTLVGHPFDTIKVFLQADGGVRALHATRGTSVGAVTRQLYNGACTALVVRATTKAVQFAFYEKAWAQARAAGHGHAGGAAASGALAGVLVCPLTAAGEWHKTLMQRLRVDLWPTRAQMIARAPRTLAWTASREVAFFSTYFALYEAGNRHAGNGGLIGVASWLACYPFDLAKTRAQLGLALPALHEVSLRTMYSGAAPALVRAYAVHWATLSSYGMLSKA